MTDPAPNTPPVPPVGDPNPPTPPTDGAPQTPEAWAQEVEKWKSLSRQNEARAKSNADAATELAKIKESQLTAEQKAQKTAETAQAEAASAKAELLRYQIASAKGVPPELLTASTEAELQAQADALIKFAGGNQSTPPAPDLGQGNRGSAPPQDANAWLRQMAGRG